MINMRRVVKIFISSPGDVMAERDIASEVIRELAQDSRYKNRFDLQIIRWEWLGLEPDLSPVEAIDKGLTKPVDCDLVVVIFKHRFGTALAHPKYQKADGSRFDSGTEYEYVNAMAGIPTPPRTERPTVYVYRCQEPMKPRGTAGNPEYWDQLNQQGALRTFFNSFTHPNPPEPQKGYNGYRDADEFKRNFTLHLIKFLDELPEVPLSWVTKSRRVPLASMGAGIGLALLIGVIWFGVIPQVGRTPPTITRTPTATATHTTLPSATETAMLTATNTQTPSWTPSMTPSHTPTLTVTQTPSATFTASISVAPSVTPSNVPISGIVKPSTGVTTNVFGAGEDVQPTANRVLPPTETNRPTPTKRPTTAVPTETRYPSPTKKPKTATPAP